MTCPKCGFESPHGMRFCGKCGATLTHPCPACGFHNPLDFAFCGMCGIRLSREIPESLRGDGMPAGGNVDADRVRPSAASMPLEGERRVVTVVVADITGSTDLMERIGNEAWVEIMNRILLALEAEIYRYGGVVDQFRGDGLVAFFGTDVAYEDDPERAVLAGLAMQEAIARFNADLAAGDHGGIRLRVGINTGEVIVASIGDARQHREDTAMGVAIALAARLESAAEPGTVLVSESTYRQCEPQFTWEKLGEITAKGFSQPMAVYRPLAARLDSESMVQLEIFGNAIPLVGRDEELDILKQHVELVKLGQGGVVFLTGEVGIGKQALITETRQYFLRQDALMANARGMDEAVPESLQWLFGRCRSFSQSWPFSLWFDLIHNWLGVYSGQNPEEIYARLKERCFELWGERYHQLFPYLAELLRLPLEGEYLEKVRFLSAEALRIKIGETVQEWLESLAQQKPLVVVLSDLEFADPSSLQLARNVVGLASRRPILFLMLYRSGAGQELETFVVALKGALPGITEEVQLKPLREADIHQLIFYLVGEHTLPEETRQLLVKNSEGNPSYIVEILRSLLEKKVLIRDSETGEWRLSRPVKAQDLQGNLNRLVQARIDRLDLNERQVIQMASVIGNVFWSNVLQMMVGEQFLVKEPLQALAKAQLIERRGRHPELGTEYSFRTDLIHDVVYESLLKHQREALHLRVASILEEFVQTQGGIEHQALIAYHYRQAGETQKELFYVTWAAEKAREVYAVEEAFHHYNRALELLDHLEQKASEPDRLEALLSQRFEVLNGRLALRYLTGDFEHATADARALLEIADRLHEQPIWKIDALLNQPAVLQADTWEAVQEALEMVEQALGLSRQIDDRYREMFALMAKSRLMFLVNNLEAFTVTQEALALARELGDPATQLSLLIELSNAYGMENPELSRKYLDEALALRDKISDKRILLDLLSALGEFQEREGNYYRLLTDFIGKRLEICREIGDRLSEGFILMYYAQVEGLYLGDYQAALERVTQALKLTEKVSGSLYPMLRIAQLQGCLGMFDEGLEVLRRAEPLCKRNILKIGEAGRLLVTMILYNRRGRVEDYRAVLGLAEEVKQLADEQRVSRQYKMAACCEASEAHVRLGLAVEDEEERATHLRKALDESATALEIYRTYGFVQIIECSSEEVLFRHGQALSLNGNEEEAGEFFSRAKEELLRKYDFIPPDSPYRRTFLENIRIHRCILEKGR